MSIPPISRSSSPNIVSPSIARNTPAGLGAFPDRLELKKEEPESFAKLYFFDSIVNVCRYALRTLFVFFDQLRTIAFEEKATSVQIKEPTLVSDLKRIPRPEDLIFEFKRVFS